MVFTLMEAAKLTQGHARDAIINVETQHTLISHNLIILGQKPVDKLHLGSAHGLRQNEVRH
jgi:hypothetical protein